MVKSIEINQEEVDTEGPVDKNAASERKEDTTTVSNDGNEGKA
ncbi:hypothetical protein PI124_g21494 [Phytophthora idaei]|nr:hypothetical protein PI125_g22900 [Phytophthora idaei]KAG3129402.1 hypothetical protein PI126_g20980 [Phytophthora idaei]KAG3233430.1 hypothetical protein PI124_g21494 [Phytophthora idaei]